MPLEYLSRLLRPSISFRSLSISTQPTMIRPTRRIISRPFSCSNPHNATYNQVVRGCRVEQRARKPTSPALVNRPELKGVCLKVAVTKPKKPNSGERKTARVRLSTGRIVTCYIPGEGMLETVWKAERAGLCWNGGRELVRKAGAGDIAKA